MSKKKKHTANGVTLETTPPSEEPQPTTTAEPEQEPLAEAPLSKALEAELDALKAELASTKDRLLRQAAEYQNYRRRTEEERRHTLQFGRAQVVEQLLDVFDDLHRSVEAASSAASESQEPTTLESLQTGIRLVYTKFSEALKKLGVEPIEAIGKAFDENEHEALMKQPAPEGTSAGTVLAEIQRGYRMGDRILRHTRVIVAD